MARGIALNLGVYILDNNNRRNVGAFSANYTTANSNTSQQNVTLAPGESYTFTPQPSPATVMTVAVTAPVLATVRTKAAQVGSYTRPIQTYSTIINSIYALDDAVDNVILTNYQSYSIEIVLITG